MGERKSRRRRRRRRRKERRRRRRLWGEIKMRNEEDASEEIRNKKRKMRG